MSPSAIDVMPSDTLPMNACAEVGAMLQLPKASDQPVPLDWA